MITEKKVLDKGQVVLLDWMGSDKDIADAARISYSSNKKAPTSDDKTLIRYLMRNRHTSVFEMAEVKFYIKLPIFVHNQLVRHRTASQNVVSGRYSEMSNEFYVPEEDKVTKQNPNNKQGGTDEYIGKCIEREDTDNYSTPYQFEYSWQEVFSWEQEQHRKEYEQKLASGMRKELARINLPLSQYTEMYWKIDLHNLFHLLSLRLDNHSQYEIRVYAEAIYELIKPLFPLACEAFEEYILKSQRFSKTELKVLANCFEYMDNDSRNILLNTLDELLELEFRNKRERDECKNKLLELIKDAI